jgi:hypothetical protein
MATPPPSPPPSPSHEADIFVFFLSFFQIFKNEGFFDDALLEELKAKEVATCIELVLHTGTKIPLVRKLEKALLAICTHPGSNVSTFQANQGQLNPSQAEKSGGDLTRAPAANKLRPAQRDLADQIDDMSLARKVMHFYTFPKFGKKIQTSALWKLYASLLVDEINPNNPKGANYGVRGVTFMIRAAHPTLEVDPKRKDDAEFGRILAQVARARKQYKKGDLDALKEVAKNPMKASDALKTQMFKKSIKTRPGRPLPPRQAQLEKELVARIKAWREGPNRINVTRALVYTCIYMYIYIHIYVYMYIYVYICIYTCM